MATLALSGIRDRVEYMLMDTGNAIWDEDTIDVAIDDAMAEYSLVSHLHMETVITLPGDGREIALASLSGLLNVIDVWWPYDSDASSETWPPNRVRGWRLWWDDAQPLLILEVKEGSQPKTDEEVRIWYTKLHTIQDLNSADSTTIPQHHERIIEIGAAGHAAMSRAVDLIETANTDLYQVGILGTYGQRKLREFRSMLQRIGREKARAGPAWGVGWTLDKWDQGRDQPLTTYG